MRLSIAKYTLSFKEDIENMKTFKLDILLYHPEQPQELRVQVRVPMKEATAQRLLDAQRSGVTILEQNALYNLAGAVGHLNGVRGIPLRISEVTE